MGEDLPRTTADVLKQSLPVWAALVTLVVATLVLAYLPLGRWNTPASLGIGAAKAVLIAVFFMNLRRPDPLLRLAGAASILWIAFMFALIFADLLTRAPVTQSGTVVPRVTSPSSLSGGRLF
ncbi:cytochrome C oxidase subunit IV family protein [Muricoccus aerilatus]|uniref:cytochrome C oxidase subunit IV family protein n=1 Tax=Muricoccus aerilatus TaxID=452982 RepID=UPI0006938C79|nr:cytochrome C oxidase subunit IV family protein [Roseomonas aerilata]